MTAVTASILEDYDHDMAPYLDPKTGEVIDPADEEKEEEIIDNLEVEIYQLEACQEAVSRFGMNRSALAVMYSTGLLSSTAMGSLGLESLEVGELSETDSHIATEALGEKIKSKVAEWSARVISFLSRSATKIGEVIKSLWSSISNAASTLGQKTWDGAKIATAYVKVHPYKVLMGAIAAAAMVMGIVFFVTGSAPGVNCAVGAFRSFMGKVKSMASAIKSPFGNVITTTSEETGLVKMALNNGGSLAPVEGKLGILGWTKSSFSAVSKQATSLWTRFEAAWIPIWNKFLKPVEKVVSNVGFFPKVVAEKVKAKTGSRVVTWGAEQMVASVYYPVMIKLFTNLFTMIKRIVVRTLEMIKQTFAALKRAVTE